MFDLAKAAHMVAFFALKAGRNINLMKVVKLVYLADRESVKRIGAPLLHDARVSMPHGPVNSGVLDAVNGAYDDPRWRSVLRDRAHHYIGVQPGIREDDLDELSDYDVEVMEAVWQEFGAMDQWELSDWTHNSNNVPEWTSPGGGAQPIPMQKFFEGVGCEDPEGASATYLASEAYLKFIHPTHV